MSFDLFLQHFSVGESSPIDPLPVMQVLSKERFRGPSEFGFYSVDFSDGVHVEFSARGLNGTEPFTGCAFHIRGIGPQLVRFVFDVARAGDFVIFNCQGDDSAESPVLILANVRQEEQLAKDIASQYTNRPVCPSAEVLGNLLFYGYDEWKQYRDKVVGGA